MTDRPILMSGPLVRPSMEDLKTRTMRTMKDKLPRWKWPDYPRAVAVWDRSHGPEVAARNGSWPTWQDEAGDARPAPCPYGLPGDRLWVRETWQIKSPWWAEEAARKRASGEVLTAEEQAHTVQWRADYADPKTQGRWTPSIFMPRWASRLTLEITSIGVQRPQELTAAEIVAEGVPFSGLPGDEYIGSPEQKRLLHDGWRKLWIGINGAASWDANPWCWVVGFRRCV